MLQYLGRLLVRVLLETAVLFLSVALLLLVFSYRLGRRVVASGPDRFEGLSGKALQALALFPRHAPSTEPSEPLESAATFDEDELEDA